jgi:hypothetical protein
MISPLAEIFSRIRRPRTLATWIIDRLFDHLEDASAWRLSTRSIT